MLKSRTKKTLDDPTKAIESSNSKPISTKSNSLSSENRGNPSATLSDVQIIVSSSNPAIMKNESTPQDERSLKQDLRKYALEGTWNKAESIYENHPELVSIPLNGNGDTALHIAVRAERNGFVEGLLKSKHVTPQDLEIPNSAGNTALCIAAILGNEQVISKMVEKNENLPLIRGYEGMLPAHLASLSNQYLALEALSNEDMLHKMAHNPKDIERLFLVSVKSSMYHATRRLFKNYPDMLAIARDEDEKLTALHIMARMDWSYEVMNEVWEKVSELEYKIMLELITQPSSVLFDAVISDNSLLVELILRSNPELVARKDSEGLTLLHIAALYRRRNIIRHILDTKGAMELIIQAVDKDGNNALHFAAQHSQKAMYRFRTSTTLNSELEWFQHMESEVLPLKLSRMINHKGEIPEDLFYDNNKDLSKEDQERANGIANSGMLVAALVATVVFAAALTSPGDKNNAWFSVFNLTNAIALFTSAASIISFLSIFTSTWFAENKLIIPQLSTLIFFGLMSLFIAIVTMVMAFAAAFFLIFEQKSKWVAYVVASFGLFPIIVFLKLQSNIFEWMDLYLYQPFLKVTSMSLLMCCVGCHVACAFCGRLLSCNWRYNPNS